MLYLRVLVAGFLSVWIAADSCTYTRKPESKEISIEQRIYIPAAGCDNGQAVPNMQFPLHGGPQVSCVDRGSSSLNTDKEPLIGEGTTAEIGTVIVMSLSRNQVVLAADSRSSILRNDGTFDRVDDRRCKLMQLSPSLMFAATGMTKTDQNLPASIYYDSQQLARQAATNFVFDPNWMERNETIKEIAAKWAWEVAFHIRRGIEARKYRPLNRTWVEGVFAGLEPNGESSVAIAKLEYSHPRPGWVVPSVSISVWSLIPPNDFTWIEAFGHKEVAEQYYSKRKVTEVTRAEHLRIRAEELRKPQRFSPEVVKQLVVLTFEKDEFQWPDGSKAVGGEVDIARLRRRGEVEWLHRKQVCSAATEQ